MAQLVGSEDIESLRIELTEIGRSNLELNSVKDEIDAEDAFPSKIDRLPTFERLKASSFDESDGSNVDLQGKRVLDSTKLGAREQRMFIEKIIKYNENDNLQLLQKMRNRVDKVGVEFPKLEVRYKNLRVEAMCEVVHGKQVPTLWKSLKSIIFDCAKLLGLKSHEAKLTIMDDVNGVIKPGRMTLLLGPPGCGKTTLLKALSGNLDKSLKVSGEVLYNGHKLEEFIPHTTSTYVTQHDLHMPEMTVRETLDFSARCQGVGSQAEFMAEVCKREKEVGVVPDPDVDTFMKAISAEGQRTTLQTNYILKVLGLDVCADGLIGDAMRRGISGGQKKRLTIGEMIIGPKKALFMDEISNGLDSSTTYQVVAYLKQLADSTDATILVALLQPEPETFDLFDDVILMEGGKVLYHGPCKCVLEFFEDCGFRCPERKRVADFFHEVISRKDQAQYWHQVEQSWSYFSVDLFRNKFKESTYGNMVDEDLSKPLVKSESHKNAISFSKYSLSKWALFSACMSREYLLMRRNSFIYVFKAIQLIIAAIITMTVFLRTRVAVDIVGANTYMGALYYALFNLFIDGLPEMSITFARLAVFYKQRNLHFYPVWSYTIPYTILKVPLSLFTALIWTSVTYYGIGYSPEPERFFRQFILLFAVHFAAISMFRFVVSISRTMAASFLAGFVSILAATVFSGFVIPKSSMPTWLKWGFWVSPMGYGEIGLVVNEFLAPRWQQTEAGNTTVGKETLENYGLYFRGYFFWLSVGALLGLAILFNIGFTLALTFLNPPSSRAIISNEKLSQIGGSENFSNGANKEAKSKSNEKTMAERPKDRLVLPFEPMTLTFQDVQYYVETPSKMREEGFNKKQLQLLCDITGALRPGILTALMGVSGAGKTTLLDVLAGRKTSGVIEGEIRIGGYPKVQDAFARISGYCEQSDVHSPQITVGESIIFSAWLRLPPEIDSQKKFEFVREVLEIIELDEIKDCLVGLPGVTGLSTEQRKRLTIAVELVANPSIIFMDEPTSGLDARAAAIVMRAVKNVASTGRTIICTIHQPSIDIFEAFDESVCKLGWFNCHPYFPAPTFSLCHGWFLAGLAVYQEKRPRLKWLLVLKNGGHIIYSGPLGQHSSNVIKYFEDIPGVKKIRNNYNPATWILEVTSSTVEADLGIDFAQVYKNSLLYQNNKAHVITLSAPPDSKELHFTTRFSQNGWEQFKFCLWKQHLSYWRSPSYNLTRFMFTLIASLFLGTLFWDQGRKLNDQQSLFNALGSIYTAAIFLGSYTSLSVVPYISTERLVLYRERFAGMYGSWAYALAQVTVEVPYLLAQAIVFSVITYPMTGYYWSAYKVLWYFYAMFCTLLSFTYLGMLLSAMTPSVTEASILQSFFFRLFNLFSGFLIPQPKIPNWWVWMYYFSPSSWALDGMLTSQYGDIQKEITVFGENKTVSAFLTDYLGYHHDHLPIVGVVLIIYPIALAFLFAYCIEKLNFQRR